MHGVAGFLLAWRMTMVTMAPQVERIEFSAGGSKHFLEKGKETSVTLTFLQDQVDNSTIPIVSPVSKGRRGTEEAKGPSVRGSLEIRRGDPFYLILCSYLSLRSNSTHT